jgi:hypothetical protein
VRSSDTRDIRPAGSAANSAGNTSNTQDIRPSQNTTLDTGQRPSRPGDNTIDGRRTDSTQDIRPQSTRDSGGTNARDTQNLRVPNNSNATGATSSQSPGAAGTRTPGSETSGVGTRPGPGGSEGSGTVV